MPAQGLQGGFHVDTTHTHKKTLVWTLHCCIDPDGRGVSTVSEVCVLHWPPGNSAPFVRHVCVLLNARCQGAGRSRHRVCSLLPSAALLRVPPQCATHLNVSNIRCAFSKSLQSSCSSFFWHLVLALGFQNTSGAVFISGASGRRELFLAACFLQER